MGQAMERCVVMMAQCHAGSSGGGNFFLDAETPGDSTGADEAEKMISGFNQLRHGRV